ncbi:cytochrome P450 67 [Delitschia confertaspora ATCC 74209]|uniref:Cytochrome P450 67 n=1 Tax=Delitschia confertaspora ATCC 74209 TaxID=1513339 RepID=A0A9P4MT21_9PLEO|nr:cytochrome P450 67 [Delitschia confertaspora ATCC 74209]
MVSLTAWTAAVLGVAFHVAIQQVEFELYMYHFIFTSIATFFGGIFALVKIGGYGFFGALFKVSFFFTAFNAALLTSIAVYRLVFHRCRDFPGPFASKITRFHATMLSAKNVQYNKELAKMHEQYGDIVRTGPREISILRKSAVNIIYGPTSECRKSTWYGQTGNDPKKCSIHMTRDFNAHRQRKRAWDKGFSIKSLATYQPRIKSKADILMSQLRKNAGKPMDMTAWSMFFSFDVMGEVGFSKDFNNLVSGTEHPAIQGVHSHMTMLGILSMVPWLLNLLSSIPGAAAGYSEFFGFCANEIREKHKTYDAEKTPQDIVSWLLKAVKEKDVSASPSPEALEDDSRVVIIAGSETTATTLAAVLFFLAKYPEKQKKLQRLLDEAMPGGYSEWDYEKVKATQYVDDFISETLRLKPALLDGGPRQTPPQGITVDEVHIPGGVNVLVPIGLIQKDKRYWQDAEEFIPERFTEKRAEMGTDNAPYLPFSLGHYACPGRNLAWLSLRTSLSSVVMNFDVTFAPGETGETFDKEALDTFTTTLPPLQLQFTPRAKNLSPR